MRLYKRNRLWFVDYIDSRGERRRESTGCTDRRAAEIEGAKRERDARDPASAALRDETVESCLKRLLDLTDNVNTRRFYELKAGHLCGVLGAQTKLAELDATDLDRFVRTRRDAGVSAHTIHKEVRTLSTALRMAKKRGRFRGDIDALMPSTRAEYTPRTRALPLDEVIRLVQAFHVSQADHAARVAFAIAVGAEWSALDRAERADIKRDSVRVRGTKSAKRDRVVPIVAEWQSWLLEFALEHAGGAKEKLFRPWPHRAAALSLERACKRAEIDRATWHDLRRTTAQLLLRGGASYESLAAVLGHATTHVTQTVYAQLRGDVLAERLRRELAEACAVFVPSAAVPPASAAPAAPEPSAKTEEISKRLVGRPGLEPGANGLKVRCSTD